MPPQPQRLSSDPQVDTLVEIYSRARRRVEYLLRAADARGAAGTAAFERQQLAAIDAVLRRLEVQSPDLITAATARSYAEGATSVDVSLGAELGQKIEPFAQGRFAGAHEAAINALAGQLDARLALARTTIGRRAPDALAAILRANVGEGIAAGLTRRQVSASIVDEAVADGLTSLVDARGRRWGIDVYAEMAARTATREAASLGVANRILENGRDLVTISVHANSCEICLPYQGKTFSLTGETPGYPKAEVLPPYHPRCRHVATPAPIFDSIGRRRPGAIDPRAPVAAVESVGG